MNERGIAHMQKVRVIVGIVMGLISGFIAALVIAVLAWFIGISILGFAEDTQAGSLGFFLFKTVARVAALAGGVVGGAVVGWIAYQYRMGWFKPETPVVPLNELKNS